MEKITQVQRIQFMFNQGIRMAGTGYYKTADVAFEQLKSHKPFTRLNIGDEGAEPSDFKMFQQGFDLIQSRRIAIMKMKATAEAQLKEILADLTAGEVSDAKHFTELESYKNEKGEFKGGRFRN